MKKPLITETVFQKLLPTFKQNAPATWTQHVQRNLVPEVREEVQRYFGRIDCLEAQYPGLDYTFDPHRRRLASFQYHRRLFRAFDELRLTREEILTLCNWEGTRAAKERFERESKTKIESTTLDGVEPQSISDGPNAVFHDTRGSSQTTPQPARTPQMPMNAHNSDEEGEEMDESAGARLNQNLIAAAAARGRGEVAHFDAQWEQWMKDAIDRHNDPEMIRHLLQQRYAASSSGVQASHRLPNPVDEHDVARPTSSGSAPARVRDVQEVFEELHSADARMAADNSELLRTRSTTERARLSTLVEELSSNTNRMEAENSALQHFLSRTRTETAR